MKKLSLFIIILSATMSINGVLYAQNESRQELPYRNNIKLNLLSKVISFAPEISYEYITAPDGAVGVKGPFNIKANPRMLTQLIIGMQTNGNLPLRWKE